MNNYIFFDVECYSNYFLICFKNYETGKNIYFELTEDSKSLDKDKIKSIFEKYTTVGFNSKSYDIPMILYSLKGANNKELKDFSDDIILNKEETLWQKLKKHNLYTPAVWNNIDLINPAKIGSQVFSIGLKTYGANLHSKKLQELPFEPCRVLTRDEMDLLREYCFNDIDVTIDLYNYIKPNLELRSKISNLYNIDMRSKSDAQIAESVFKSKLNISSYDDLFKKDAIYKCVIPSYIKFKDNNLNKFVEEIRNFDFKCDEKGKFELPAYINNDFISDIDNYQFSMIDEEPIVKTSSKIIIDNKEYALGVGGLHSTEKHQATTISDDEFIIDADVTSYYPTIILNNKFYPKHLSEKFLEVYRNIYDGRIEAKKNNDKVTSDIYKIVLNGSFGKFGSRYSILYSPELLLSTTITGQLSLLMLIEMIVNTCCKVISANTDGITIKGKKENKEFLDLILEEWQKITNFNLEYTEYKAVYNEAVNSYIAIEKDNKIKSKGIYAKPSISKNPFLQVCVEAVTNYLKNGDSIENYIRNCNDIRKFIVVRKVKDGAIWKDQFLGKIVRWYYSKNGEPVRSLKKGDKVAGSDYAKPLPILSDDIPNDIDYNLYISKAYEMLKRLGIR